MIAAEAGKSAEKGAEKGADKAAAESSKPSEEPVAACAVYSATMVAAYAASTLSHVLTAPRARNILRTADQAVIWRGPMLHSALLQFLKDVDWGDLDFLLLDLPPGTGDVALTLSQRVRSTGAIIVTTPQEVALQDVYKSESDTNQRNQAIGALMLAYGYIKDNWQQAVDLFDDGVDLDALGTFGFRGEALPSIASVARLTVETAEPGGVGSRVRMSGGKIHGVEDTARQSGTTVLVKNLFFNVPARAKFLRSAASEARAVSEVVAGPIEDHVIEEDA